MTGTTTSFEEEKTHPLMVPLLGLATIIMGLISLIVVALFFIVFIPQGLLVTFAVALVLGIAAFPLSMLPAWVGWVGVAIFGVSVLGNAATQAFPRIFMDDDDECDEGY